MRFVKAVVLFYYEGLRRMTWGRVLWFVILVKLFIIFVVLKGFFFKDFLSSNFKSDKERSEYVIEQLTNQNP